MTVSSQGWPPESVLDAGDANEGNASGLFDTPGQRWYTCDRCGFIFPESETEIEPLTGLRVCLTGPHDFDRVDPGDRRLKNTLGTHFFEEE